MVNVSRGLRMTAAACLAGLVLIFATAAPAAEKNPSRPISRFAQMDGHKLHYWSMGRGEKALVFIHGWSCDASFWQGQLGAFASDFHQVIALDLLGHGLSGKPELEYDFDIFIKGIRAVLVNAGVKEAVLCGHSLGGSLGRFIALKDGAGIKGLVLVDGAFCFPPADPKARQRWLDENRGFTARFKMDGYKETVRSFVFSMLGPAITPELTVRIIEGMLKTPAHVGISAMRHFPDPENWSGAPLKLPVLAVYAKSPETTEDFKRNLRGMFPSMDYHELKGMGHFFMMEKPGKLNPLLKAFLRKQKFSGK